MNTTIIIATRDQLLVKLKTPIITSGNDSTNKIQFRFDRIWKNLKNAENTVLKVAFYRSDDSIVKINVDEDDMCTIPQSMLIDPGILKFGLFAEANENQVKTSNISSYVILPGTKINATPSSDPIRESDKNALSAALSSITGTDYSSYSWNELIEEISNLEPAEYKEYIEYASDALWNYYKEWWSEIIIPVIPGDEIIDTDEIE